MKSNTLVNVLKCQAEPYLHDDDLSTESNESESKLSDTFSTS